MTNDSRMTEYLRKCDEYDAREAELNKVVGYRAQYPGGTHAPPPCGCRVEGDGNLQSPLRIRFCALHLGNRDELHDQLGREHEMFVTTSQKLEAALKLASTAVDHLETVLSSDSDMPSHDADEAAASDFIDEARTAIGGLS